VPSAKVFTTQSAPNDLLTTIRGLVSEAFDDALSDDDWEHALGGWHVVLLDAGAVVAHAAVVPRAIAVAGSQLRGGYVEAVATAPRRQGEGLGSLVMARVGRLLRTEFEIGALSTGLHGFYERLGWELWRGPTFVRHDSELIRTEDEDDGVMVLRFGPSLELDLTNPISCPARNGDNW
jgi:aminoglycoside 2'-N-acetyltransferase I